MSLLFHCIKADHPSDSGLEGECTAKSLHELPRLSLTNLSSLRTVLLCIICLLQCWEVLLPLGEHLAKTNTALGAALLQPWILILMDLLVPLSDKPFGVWLSQCLLCRMKCASRRFHSCCLLQRVCCFTDLNLWPSAQRQNLHFLLCPRLFSFNPCVTSLIAFIEFLAADLWPLMLLVFHGKNFPFIYYFMIWLALVLQTRAAFSQYSLSFPWDCGSSA